MWYWDCTFTLAVPCLIKDESLGGNAFAFGKDIALQSYPLHRLMSQLQLSLNNNSSTDLKRYTNPFYFNGLDSNINKFYDGATPCALDNVLYFSDASGTSFNVVDDGEAVSAGKHSLPHRGASACVLGVSTALPVVEGTFDTQIDGATTCYVKVRCIERLQISPLMFSKDGMNNSGLYGLINASVVINLNSGSNLLSTTLISPNGDVVGDPTAYPTSCSLYSVESSDLRLTYLTPKPSVLLPPVCYVPYYNLLNYITPFTPPSVGTSTTITSKSLQLNMIPDRLMVCCPYVASDSKGIADSDSFFEITGVSIMFNNTAGLLSQASQHQLWYYSSESGSTQEWLKFSGKRNVYDTVADATTAVKTSGSILFLDLGKIVAIQEVYASSGSLGAYNIQITLTIKNNLDSGRSDVPSSCDMIIATMNSGFCAVSSGTTTFALGLLTKSEVLACLEEAQNHHPVYRDDMRLLGGGVSGGDIFGNLLGHLGTLANKIAKPVAHFIANKLEKSDSQVDKMLSHGLKKLAGDGRHKKH
jgi:hypothetical protein